MAHGAAFARVASVRLGVALFPVPAHRTEQARFAAWYRGSNPESPQVVNGRFGIATVRIKAISLLADNVASVRFLKESRKGEETRVTHWVATLTFSYVNAPMSSADRLINPLGFLVSDYRADPEVVP